MRNALILDAPIVPDKGGIRRISGLINVILFDQTVMHPTVRYIVRESLYCYKWAASKYCVLYENLFNTITQLLA